MSPRRREIGQVGAETNRLFTLTNWYSRNVRRLKLSSRHRRNSSKQVLTLIQKTLHHIAEAIARREKVELRNFGIFEVKVQKARIGRNPRKPSKDVTIPSRAVVKFRAGRELREAVFKLSPGSKAFPALRSSVSSSPSKN